MQWLRTAKISAIIYGLDADLILLSMLVGSECGLPLWLLREKQEFGGKMITDEDGEQEYTFMYLEEFKGRVGVKGEYEATLNYVALMSLMGNDFLPHSLTHKLNDDGHDCVLKEFRTMCQRKTWLVKDGQLQLNILLDICKRWATDENERMAHMIAKKREQAARGVGKGMDESEALPLEWNVESVLINEKGLIEGWRNEYWLAIHPDGQGRAEELCGEYITGCQWILDYYTGKQVNRAWMFSSWIPPLWSDLVGWLTNHTSIPVIPGTDVQIQPAEQLAMVLPLDSWGLIRDRFLRRLPALAPQMWPAKFEFFSLGRKWLWECEARIPVLTAVRLREILSEAR
jgi:5'-3' exonuclease